MADTFQAKNIFELEGYGLEGDDVINVFKGVLEPDHDPEVTNDEVTINWPAPGKAVQITLYSGFFHGFSESETDVKKAVKETMAADARALKGSFYPEYGPNSGGE